MADVTAEDYRAALVLLDEGVDRCAAMLVKHNKGGTYRALFKPHEHADFALRLARALHDDARTNEEET